MSSLERAPDPARGSTLRILTERNFGVYFFGNSVSNIGTWFQNIAAAILVFRLTGSTLLVGVVNFAQFAGAMLLAPWAGAAADRFDRRKLLIVAQLLATVTSAVLAVLAAAGLASAPVVIAAAAVLGVSLAFMAPALLALVPLLVTRDDLTSALSLNSVSFNLARAIGPVIGAVVVDRFGVAVAFAVNAMTFLVFLVALLFVETKPQILATGPLPKLRDTARMVAADPLLLSLMLTIAVVSISTDPVNTLTPEVATRVLGGSDTLTGALVGAFGGGATLMALAGMGWLRRRKHRLVTAMLAEGIGLVVFGLATTLWLALAGMAIAGAGFLGGVTLATTRIQLTVADNELGRVMALWSLAFIGTRPIASLLDGVVADLAGTRAASLVMAAPVLVGAVVMARVLKRLRDQAPEEHRAGDGIPSAS